MEIHNYTGEEHAIRLDGSRHDLDPQTTLATTCKISGALPRLNRLANSESLIGQGKDWLHQLDRTPKVSVVYQSKAHLLS